VPESKDPYVVTVLTQERSLDYASARRKSAAEGEGADASLRMTPSTSVNRFLFHGAMFALVIRDASLPQGNVAPGLAAVVGG
jgi:hypothetical protein